MNKIEYDILNALDKKTYVTQRILAEESGYSVGIVNRSVKLLKEHGLLDDQMQLTQAAHKILNENKTKNAIILAAGFGMRMVPINVETSKGLLEVNGQPLIERTICQLQEAGIENIYIVVGYMKEKYEYLMDKYNVKLLVNPEYASKNNLHSLKYAMKHLANSYIIPCDLWCKTNPYSQHEFYSWYMVSDKLDSSSDIRANRKMQLVSSKNKPGNVMLGICYLDKTMASIVQKRMSQFMEDKHYNDSFWEETLYEGSDMLPNAKVVSESDVIEINTYEQLRELDGSSKQLQTSAILTIANTMNVSVNEISNITALKKGMTNRSFLFECNGEKFIMRIPGEGTDQLINRYEEADVYSQIGGKNICDDVYYMNPENGYKITKYLEDARVCDPLNVSDLERCMKKLREFHNRKLQVAHTFDIWKQIDFYESLWTAPSAYSDYVTTKKNVFSLKQFVDNHKEPYVLTHIDAVPDNFLFTKNKEVPIRLIDWEYAGMQDPHVDIAMFCIYSLYDREQVDQLIDLYFQNQCSEDTRFKIYCYIAMCGLLWSNWCEYKRQLGVEFGEYSLRQYRYAKEYYRIVQKRLLEMEDESCML